MFFAPLCQALQTPGITRGGGTVDDASFVTLAGRRALENSKTGRDFVQTHGMPTTPGLTRSNYFDGLASSRRLKMFIALERELQRQQLPMLRAHDDRLAHFGELAQMQIRTGDDLHIVHATTGSIPAKSGAAGRFQNLRCGCLAQKAFRPKSSYFPPEIANFGLIKVGTY